MSRILRKTCKIDNTYIEEKLFLVTNDISDNETSLHFKSLSYITFVINNEDKICHILTVHSNVQGKGYAKMVIRECIKICREMDIKMIDLDDMSDHFRKPHNIYKNFGFKYTHDTGPEMYLKLQK